MSQDLYRLVYYSRNRIAGSSDAIGREISGILHASRLNNARVAGALMFNAGCFAQILEGPRAEVERTFERIQQDEQRGDVSLLAFEASQTRSFESWSMAFVGSSVSDVARYGSIARDTGFDPSRMDSDALFDLLRRLVVEEEKSPAESQIRCAIFEPPGRGIHSLPIAV